MTVFYAAAITLAVSSERRLCRAGHMVNVW